MSVLTVDDQAVFRGAARDVIEATAGFTSAGEASCGEEAVVLIDREEPDLTLVDVRMPGMDGIETARRIKENHPDMVVVLITIEDPVSFRPQAMAAGAAALVRQQDSGPALPRKLRVAHGRGS